MIFWARTARSARWLSDIFFEQYPIALKVSMPIRQQRPKRDGYERQGNARKPAFQFWLRKP
jgi:hypothetical protein